MRCASAGVSLLHVAGSLRRSYTVAGKVSYTDRFDANASRFVGAVAERCESVGGCAAENIVESAGADEFGCVKRPFSVLPEFMLLVSVVSLCAGSSESPLFSKESGGMNAPVPVPAPLFDADWPFVAPCALCLCSPSM